MKGNEARIDFGGKKMKKGGFLDGTDFVRNISGPRKIKFIVKFRKEL